MTLLLICTVLASGCSMGVSMRFCSAVALLTVITFTMMLHGLGHLFGRGRSRKESIPDTQKTENHKYD
jgi:hypothetical protein